MYETVIGLEIHVQLATRSKIFCADDASFGGLPNTHTSVVSLAHPGTLPRLNRTAVEYAVRLGLALGCDISRLSTFDRKNYFYADLPKGFQTTQQNRPICVGGALELKAESADTQHSPAGIPATRIRLHHIHLEEDAGKSLHDQDAADSLIDLNRAGVPLLEIVTEPDLRSAGEAAAFMTEIRRLVRWLGISDGNMEEGSLRCDVNISVRKTGAEKLGNRCEIKNVNSMRFARRAIAFEVQRQIAIVESGGTVEQETRGFHPDSGETYSLREKEDAHDYRYFPEPDLPPVVLSEGFLEKIKKEILPLPQSLEREFQTEYGLPAEYAGLLTAERDTALFFLKLVESSGSKVERSDLPPSTINLQPSPVLKAAANLVVNKLLPWSAETGRPLSDCPVSPAAWLEFLHLIESGQVSASTAYQQLFPALLEKPHHSPALLAGDLQLLQNADADFLDQLVGDVLARFPEKVAEYRKGKKGLIGFFMGEVVKAGKGQAEPKAATRLLEKKLAG